MSCRALVQGLHDWYASDADSDVVVLNVVALDSDGRYSDADTAAEWAEVLDLSWVVLADPEGEWLAKWGGNDGKSQHSYTVLDADGVLTWKEHSGSSESVDAIIDAIEDARQ
ncbi:MAG: hypothetical protein ACI8PZ_001827 [Myxococcota bacterium]|jgi:hypothetical protein